MIEDWGIDSKIGGLAGINPTIDQSPNESHNHQSVILNESSDLQSTNLQLKCRLTPKPGSTSFVNRSGATKSSTTSTALPRYPTPTSTGSCTSSSSWRSSILISS